MSTTNIYELFKTKVNCIDELRNGHGSGPAIWNYISEKLYRKQFNLMDDKEFWLSYKDKRLNDNEKAVLLSTYDRAFIEVDRLHEFAEACKEVHKKIIETTDWTWSHFEAIGLAADNLYKEHDARCLGLAIGCTSVCDEWEQEKRADIETWGIYEEIDEMNKQNKKIG